MFLADGLTAHDWRKCPHDFSSGVRCAVCRVRRYLGGRARGKKATAGVDHTVAGYPLAHSIEKIPGGSLHPENRHTKPARVACIRGHAMTAENTYTRADGYTACRACVRLYVAKRKERLAA